MTCKHLKVKQLERLSAYFCKNLFCECSIRIEFFSVENCVLFELLKALNQG